MRQSLTRRTLSAIALVASIAVASLTLSVAAFAQDTTTTDPVNPYTSTTPTVEPTVDTLPETTETTPPPPPTSTAEPAPTSTSDTAPAPPTATAAPAPTATTAAKPNTPPKRLAFTGYDPLIIGFVGLALMLGAVALQRRRGTR